MTNDNWADQNSKYLSVSLEWLRQRLLAITKQPDPVPQPVIITTEPKRGWLGRSAAPETQAPVLAKNVAPSLPQTAGSATPGSVGEAVAARDAAAQITPPPALVQLAEEFGLSTFERDVLLLCCAVEFDPVFTSLIGKAMGNGSRENPTFGLALSLLDDPHWDALSAQRPLRSARLIELNQAGSTPLTASALRTDERILAFIKGINALDDRLGSLLSQVTDAERHDLSASQQEVCDRVLADMHTSISGGSIPLVQLTGTDAVTKLALASHLCETLGSRLYRVTADVLPMAASDTDGFVKLWQRETCLLPIALYVDAEEIDSAPADVHSGLTRLMSKSLGLVFVSLRDNPLKLGIPSVTAEIGKPSRAEQFEAWSGALEAAGVDDAETCQQLAGQFDVSLAEIQQIVAQTAPSLGDDAVPSILLWNRCRSLTKPRLDELASRIDTKATWDDLVLPSEQTRLMRSITDQVRERYKVYNEWGFSERMNRGFGISALFAGESGTGKTMAAEVIANELRLNLYRIDLSSVVSKYIGETEKNLRKMFDAAEQGGAILFFDEADALFGKRSEVKDSHDRYANIEINYLLQRMESFSGLAILATNTKSALDTAFMRRLRFIVNFPIPAPADRKRIWQKALPVQTPQEDLDFDRLARLNVTGANIQSIALNAAFQAAGAGTSVTMPALLSAAYVEMRKLERPLTEADLR